MGTLQGFTTSYIPIHSYIYVCIRRALILGVTKRMCMYVYRLQRFWLSMKSPCWAKISSNYWIKSPGDSLPLCTYTYIHTHWRWTRLAVGACEIRTCRWEESKWFSLETFYNCHPFSKVSIHTYIHTYIHTHTTRPVMTDEDTPPSILLYSTRGLT